MSTFAKNLNRVAEIARMFMGFGTASSDERVQIYIEDTACIPDRFFADSVRKATSTAKSGFPPSVGEIIFAYRSIDTAGAAENIRTAQDRSGRFDGGRQLPSLPSSGDRSTYFDIRTASETEIRVECEKSRVIAVRAAEIFHAGKSVPQNIFGRVLSHLQACIERGEAIEVARTRLAAYDRMMRDVVDRDWWDRAREGGQIRGC